MMDLNSLDEILEAVETCKKCKLYKFRDKCVFAEGRNDAKTILIGLSPGKEEISAQGYKNNSNVSSCCRIKNPWFIRFDKERLVNVAAMNFVY